MTAATGSMGRRLAARMMGERILAVDDEPVVCELISRWLDAEGYDCHVASTGEQAWDMLKANKFALLITDIRMPGMSGMELLALVTQELPETAAIMLTAVADRETAVEALELGAFGYLTKPFDKNEVLINVVNALERRRLMLADHDYAHKLEEKVGRQTEDIRNSREEIVMRLVAAQGYRHDETGAHVRRMALYSEAVAVGLGHPAEYTDMIRLAASMHDVGKIGIPDAILLKPGKLTDEEFDVMKDHTIIGARILEGTSIPLLNVARDIALSHHEKWDGSGYPRGLAGDIPEVARIVAVVDVYDALTNERVYRPAMPEDKALGLMKGDVGTHFDPDTFAVFLGTLPELHRIREEVAGDE